MNHFAVLRKLTQRYQPPMCAYMLSHAWLFGTPWTIARQAPLSMEFFRQEYCRGKSFPSPGDLPNPGIEFCLLHCRQILYRLSHQGSPKSTTLKKKKKEKKFFNALTLVREQAINIVITLSLFLRTTHASTTLIPVSQLQRLMLRGFK